MSGRTDAGAGAVLVGVNGGAATGLAVPDDPHPAASTASAVAAKVRAVGLTTPACHGAKGLPRSKGTVPYQQDRTP
jgi:hypothetical protein